MTVIEKEIETIYKSQASLSERDFDDNEEKDEEQDSQQEEIEIK